MSCSSQGSRYRFGQNPRIVSGPSSAAMPASLSLRLRMSRVLCRDTVSTDLRTPDGRAAEQSPGLHAPFHPHYLARLAGPRMFLSPLPPPVCPPNFPLPIPLFSGAPLALIIPLPFCQQASAGGEECGLVEGGHLKYSVCNYSTRLRGQTLRQLEA